MRIIIKIINMKYFTTITQVLCRLWVERVLRSRRGGACARGDLAAQNPAKQAPTLPEFARDNPKS